MKSRHLLRLLTAFALLTSFNLLAEILCDRPFQTPADLKNIYHFEPTTMRLVETDAHKRALEISIPEDDSKTRSVISIQLPTERIRGRRLTISADIKCDLSNPVKRFGGGQFILWCNAPAKMSGVWENRHVGAGKTPWKSFALTVNIPHHIDNALVHLGIDGARGRILYRNLKVTADDTFLNLAPHANMGFADDIAGDQKGGWHDQGSDHDASHFPIRNKLFANVPFNILNPKNLRGNAILTFECPKLPAAHQQVSIPIPCPVPGRFLYLLHCSAWGQKPNTQVATVILTDTHGKQAEIPLLYGKDVNEWWGAKPAKNAVIGVQFAAKAGLGAAYVSRLSIPPELGPVTNVTFRKTPRTNALWMLIAATISQTQYVYPEAQKLVMQADDIWRPLPQDIVPAPLKGSALDFSQLYPKHKVGEFGRLVITPDGRFEFEKRPGQNVRFISACMGRDLGNFFGVPSEMQDKAMIERYADQIQRAGYNMVRFWANVLKDTNYQKVKAYQFNPDAVDKIDYFFHCLRQRGIYVFLSIQINTFAFDSCYPWGDKRLKDWSLFTHPQAFDAWCKATEKVLTHVNPYTGLRWLDDPVITMIDCNNELEFAFLRAGNSYAPLFRQFLKDKYGSFAKLKQAWGADADALSSFEDITTFKPLGQDKPGQLNRDRALFISEQEKRIYEAEKKWLRQLGWQGPVTSFLMGKSMRHVSVRRDFDFVAQNGYHCHPSSSGVTTGGTVAQTSSVEVAANIMRSFIAARIYGKPFVVTEHGHVFWNRHRYEQGMVMGALASLNDFNGLTAFFMPVTTHPNCRLTSFEIRHDPISRASELMTNLLFRRHDAKTATLTTRIHIDADDMIRSDAVTDSVSASQLLLGLLGQCHVDLSTAPAQPQEIILERAGSSKTAVRHADSNIIDNPDQAFDFSAIVYKLKQRGLLPASNLTNHDQGIYHSSTGEILLDCPNKTMTVDTPRFQGLCAPAGSARQLTDFHVQAMNRHACVALTAIDGDRAIRNASRLLLFITTNVLNTGMSFENSDRQTRIASGTTPLLLETGTFTVTIKHRHASQLKLYALALDGSRLQEIQPTHTSPASRQFTIDTASIKNGPAIYFELQTTAN